MFSVLKLEEIGDSFLLRHLKFKNMSQTQYTFFIEALRRLFHGCSFKYKRETLHLPPTIPFPYDFLRGIKTPVDPLDKFIMTLPEDFRRNARTELYRTRRGWIDRGIEEGEIIKFREGDALRLVPILSKPAVGIDSSSNVFGICCFDNYQGGIVYVDKYLHLPKSSGKKEYKWYKTNQDNRIKLLEHLQTILNVSCKGMFLIYTDLINSKNKLTYNEMVGLIEGCFSGYENNPEQNGEHRTYLKRYFFNLCNETPIHCDPDFQTLRPDKIVKLLVQTLSKRRGKVQEYTPYYVPLESEKSLPIQLADLIVGSLSLKLRNNERPPKPLRHLLFDDRKLSKKDKKEGRWAKGYYWLREDG